MNPDKTASAQPGAATQPPNRQFALSVGAIILAILLFDIQGTLIKFLGRDYPLPQIQFFRNFFGLFPALVVLLLSREWHRSGRPIKLTRWKLGLARGVILILAQLCFYHSLIAMELATATTLSFSGPLFITLLSVIVLNQSVGLWRSLAVLLGFAGVVMVMQPGSMKMSPVMLLPVGAAFFYALASVSSRLFDRDVPTAVITLYSSSVTAILSALLMIITSGFIEIDSSRDWWLICAMGSAGGFAVVLLILAYRMTDPGSLSPFEYFGIPFSFLLGWVVFDEAPINQLFPGVLFIVAGGLLVVWRERQINSA